ncbi:glycoside hydrolase family 16 protein [Rhizobacter sp. SG703]|uniref:glycoside hydrolase family 16 protein n=1 Tax=Rhizobacter sp. SG703 TaxID=2587140 RepID=UPI0014484B94|nr:glycoside hydrolase family 16 protein [Rhizobacter sp. SG703]NKI97850.1 hypothetical protein [Rhizobacter sp. SG703]
MKIQRLSLAACVVAGTLLAVAGCAAVPAPMSAPDAGVFFDDFSQPSVSALVAGGWTVRDQRGHPGIDGAGWGAGALSLVDDPAQRGNRLLRLTARTDGTPAGTTQAQLCHARKYLEGTYAARVRFSDTPVQGPDGDVLVQTFYTVSPLRFAYDPQYSEIDWEYLPNGGWGDARTRLYGVTWQTVRLDPWDAYNQPLQHVAALGPAGGGWHVLVMQVAQGRSRFFLDGRQLDEHGGRNYPVVPMAIAFSQWFVPAGQLAGVSVPRAYEEDVDWVYHARSRVMTPAEVEQAVQALRRSGQTAVDTVPAAEPPLASTCDF